MSRIRFDRSHFMLCPMRRRLVRVVMGSTLLAGFVGAAAAQNTAVAHWQRTKPEISPPVIDSMPIELANDLKFVVAAWNESPVVQTSVQKRPAPGNSCNPIQGAIRFCVLTDNNPFFAGNQSFSGRDGHLIAVRAIMHDDFISLPQYNSTSGRRAVFCYLLGVSYGVTPQDLDPTNPDFLDVSGQESCMDATDTPEGNENPTPVDFAGLAELYEHSHTDFGVREVSGKGLGEPLPSAAEIGANLGKVSRYDRSGRPAEYVRTLPNGIKVITRVLIPR